MVGCMLSEKESLPSFLVGDKPRAVLRRRRVRKEETRDDLSSKEGGGTFAESLLRDDENFMRRFGDVYWEGSALTWGHP